MQGPGPKSRLRCGADPCGIGMTLARELGPAMQLAVGVPPLRGAGLLRCASSRQRYRRLAPVGRPSLTQRGQAGGAGAHHK